MNSYDKYEQLVISGFCFLKRNGNEIYMENRFSGLVAVYNKKTRKVTPLPYLDRLKLNTPQK